MSLASNKASIGITRRFTVEGVHPYDQIEWERRDARLTNWKDGSIAFEQLGVEVPADWSLNATNIVAQKYFRGTPGTPEREWSFKQVVDRVADTITDWGIHGGYFADNEEVEAFRNELKYILVTQRAAFNSPVWFNIGVKGVPQQASACFILSVDDTMESIMNWYREEGFIFKGGSGAGVNLSKIRSSVEGLNGGGTASGPVSFMRGADASAGTIKSGGKCIAPWTKVYTAEQGPVEVQELAKSGKDFITLSYNPILGRVQACTARAWKSGHKKLVKLVTDKGEFTMSSDHPVLLMSGGYRTAETLTPGMSIRPATVVIQESGYHRVGMHDGSKGKMDIHRLVAQDIMGCDIKGLGVHHKDRNPANNAPTNLEVLPRGEHISIHAAEDFAAGTHPFLRFHGEGNHRAVAGDSNGMSFASGNRTEDYRANQIAGMRREGVYTKGQHAASRQRMLNKAYEIVNNGGSIDSFEEYFVGRRSLAGKMGYSKAEQKAKIEERFGSYDAFRDEVRANNHRVVSVEELGYSDVYDVEVDNDTPRDKSDRDGHNFMIVSETNNQQGFTGIFVSNTRRAAKMVILNVDHPDVEEFIWCKAIEERKARTLRDAGFDMDLDGKDSISIQYQNANNSVRVTDEFMQAVVDDADWHYREVKTGAIIKTVRARDLMRQIAEAAWECADPGMQFDTTINRWHTSANTDRINGSNPCFPGSARVHTSKGLIRFDEIFKRANEGEHFEVYTHDATNVDSPEEKVLLTTPEAFMITGINDIVRLTFSNGAVLRCTPGHRIFTTNRGYVEAKDITEEDKIKMLDLEAPATDADIAIPIPSDPELYVTKGDSKDPLNFPEDWSEDFAHYLGWLIGDGSTSNTSTVTIYGSEEDKTEILTRHYTLATWMNGGREPKLSVADNGVTQLRLSRRAIKRFMEELGVKSVTGPNKEIPWSIEQAPQFAVAAFLRGLFDADGCAVIGSNNTVQLGSASQELLRGTQRLLTTFGIGSRIYKTKDAVEDSGFSYTRKNGETVSYGSSASYSLRISGPNVVKFAKHIGFALPGKAAILAEMAEGEFYNTDQTTRLVDRIEDDSELTYNLKEPRNHSYVVDGVVVRNCSEYMHIDNSACNLASLNLLKFLGEDGTFDVESFKHAVAVIFTAQEILVGNADYPTEAIGDNSRKFRQLGLGFANIGALLMALGLPYDSDGGRAWAGAITALMTGHAYATSARTAARMGPFSGYAENEEHMLRVLGMHKDAIAEINSELAPAEILDAAAESWLQACEVGAQYGVRNSQASVIAPTGTIGLLLDCDTTGIEPDLGLVKMKKLVGGGTMSIVNQTIPRALRRLGYDETQVADIIAYIDENKSILGAPHLAADHVAVFACSMGDNTIHYSGHVRMMAAVQPFISGAISKTVNLPEEATVEEVEQLHIDAWRLGVKAIAIYRDNCKVGQPLSTAKKDGEKDGVEIVETVERIVERIVHEPIRERLPRARMARTFEFRVSDCKGFVTVGEYEDGRPGEVFIRVSKQGSTLAGIVDALSIAISHGLQYGVPMRSYVKAFIGMRFEPAGMTDDPDVRIANSLMDYLFRKLAIMYLTSEERERLNISTTSERRQVLAETLLKETPESLDEVDEEFFEEVAEAVVEDVALQPAGSRPVDAPMCMQCGVHMVRSGSCHACPSCGNTSGCS